MNNSESFVKMMQLFCVVVSTELQQSVNLCHWFGLSPNQTISDLLMEMNVVFDPRVVQSIAFTDADDYSGLGFDKPISDLKISNPCAVCVTLKDPSIKTKDDEQTPLEQLDREFVSSSYHERLEMLGISVDDLHLPVVKFTNGGVVVSQENEYDDFEASSFINFRDLFAVAFGMHPSVFFTPICDFYRHHPEKPCWWPENVPYDGVTPSDLSFEQKRSLYIALLELFGIETPLVMKKTRRRGRPKREGKQALRVKRQRKKKTV